MTGEELGRRIRQHVSDKGLKLGVTLRDIGLCDKSALARLEYVKKPKIETIQKIEKYLEENQ
jgi:hypothetical protein